MKVVTLRLHRMHRAFDHRLALRERGAVQREPLLEKRRGIDHDVRLRDQPRGVVVIRILFARR